MMKLNWVFVGLFLRCCVCLAVAGEKKIVIAHRGASGYLPEHSMSAKAVAYAMGADYIEQDVVMTKDDRLVVLHDHFLDQVTNVAEVYPDRARDNGRYYAIDFTLEEIRSLNMTERFKVKDGRQSAVFPDRFPLWKSSFRVHTFAEEIELIQGMNASAGQNVGIYPEIKSPAFHRQEGKDISRVVLKVLKKYGYADKEDRIYLQCFDAIELERISKELLPEYGMKLKLTQLIPAPNWKSSDGDGSWMFKPGAMERIARYAAGVGPDLSMIVNPKSTRGHLIITDVVKDAHAAGLVIHPYTFRVENVPAYAASFKEMLDIFFDQAGIDGAFTDFPDRMINN
jgi:glycerophosphoryl diester phosphodiesterase